MTMVRALQLKRAALTSACNFDERKHDNGMMCLFLGRPFGECGGPCEADTDADGICDRSSTHVSDEL